MKKVVLRNTQLKTCLVKDLVRIGPDHDGGYVLPEPGKSTSLNLLSIGLGNEFQFEREMIEKWKCNFLVTVEPTWSIQIRVKHLIKTLIFERQQFVSELKNAFQILFFVLSNINKIKHVPRFLSSTKLSGRREIALFDITSKYEKKFSILKMDIEGAEYDILRSSQKILKDFETLIIEFHDIDSRLSEFRDIIEIIREKFHVIHIHANNCSIETGALKVVEVTFLLASSCMAENHSSQADFPIKGLDYRNIPTLEDFELILQ